MHLGGMSFAGQLVGLLPPFQCQKKNHHHHRAPGTSLRRGGQARVKRPLFFSPMSLAVACCSCPAPSRGGRADNYVIMGVPANFLPFGDVPFLFLLWGLNVFLMKKVFGKYW